MTAAAAKKYHVPYWLLWGVKVIETGPKGTGIGAVSSAGAEGPFQFIPETAAAYHVNVNSFQSSANGAAHYLHDLYKQYGNWNDALAHYSGGGYGLSTVKHETAASGVPVGTSGHSQLVGLGLPGESGENPLLELFGEVFKPNAPGTPGGDLEQLHAPSIGGSLFSFPGEILEGFQQFTKIAKLLTDPKFWLRVGEAIGGVILVYIALKSLTGTGVSDVPGAGLASQAAKAAAFKRLPPAQRVK
jgi:hypothetical protein